MKTALLLLALALLAGCRKGAPKPKRERRILQETSIQGCVSYVFDMGAEFAKVDRRAWMAVSCPDGRDLTSVIEDGRKYQ